MYLEITKALIPPLVNIVYSYIDYSYIEQKAKIVRDDLHLLTHIYSLPWFGLYKYMTFLDLIKNIQLDNAHSLFPS